MAIPDYQTIMLPLLKFLSDQDVHKLRDTINHISDDFNLSEDERKELLPSGQQPIIHNRIGWARTYMKKAGLVTYPKRGYTKITDRGLKVLAENPKKINVTFLEQFQEFVEFRSVEKPDPDPDGDPIKEKTPDELMELGSKLINESLIQEMLSKIRINDPYFFEEVVGKLLAAMGYGKYEITPKSGDKGVDGIVYQDKLGLDKLFFQAKRYDKHNNVPARDVRDFVGTLDLHGVNKGIFITTSKFPKDTDTILLKTPKHIVMIDGVELARLMIEHDVGVSTDKVYKIKKIDSDFFPE